MNGPFQRRCASGRSPTHAARSYVLACAISAIGVVPAVGHAKGNPVLVLGKHYTADVSMAYTRAGTPVAKSRSKDSSQPLDVALSGPGGISAEATASAFSVSVAATARNNPPLQLSATTAQASATSSVTFAALPGSRSPLSLDYLDPGLPFFSFSADIFDVTTHKDVYSLEWSEGQGAMPLAGASGSLPIDAFLVPFHLYELTLDVSTEAANDSESLTLSIGGLNPLTFGRSVPLAQTFAESNAVALAVPEPTAPSLILAAMGWILVRRFAGRRQQPGAGPRHG
jgi:hypothetical protein